MTEQLKMVSSARIKELVTEYVTGTEDYCDPPEWFTGTTEDFHRLTRHVLTDFLRLLEDG